MPSASREHNRLRSSITRIAAVMGAVTVMTGLSVGPSAVGAIGTAQPRLPSTISELSPSPGQTVGVGHPVTVTFTAPVSDRVAVQTSFAVRPADATPAQGTFSWLDDRTMQWTPAQFFPAHAPIDVSVGGFSTSFQTGSSVVGVADLDAHTFTVSIDGVVAREMPASMSSRSIPRPSASSPRWRSRSPW